MRAQSSSNYGNKIQELEGQLDSYKSRERDMSDKLESFKSKLDHASYSVGEMRPEG